MPSEMRLSKKKIHQQHMKDMLIWYIPTWKRTTCIMVSKVSGRITMGFAWRSGKDIPSMLGVEISCGRALKAQFADDFCQVARRPLGALLWVKVGRLDHQGKITFYLRGPHLSDEHKKMVKGGYLDVLQKREGCNKE